MSKTKGVLVWAPTYHSHSAGVRACYVLASLLVMKGFRVHIMPFAGVPQSPDCGIFGLQYLVRQVFEILLASDDVKNDLHDNWIHIYPESIYDVLPHIPFLTEKSFWWNLAPNTYIKDRPIPKNRYSWIRWGEEYDGDLLGVDVMRAGFKPLSYHVDRKGLVVYEGKGIINLDVINKWRQGEERVIIYTKYSETLTPDVLQTARLALTFDGNTSFSTEAAICGCPVIIADCAKPKFNINNIGRFPQFGIIEENEYTSYSSLYNEAQKQHLAFQDLRIVFRQELERLVERMRQ